MIKRKIRLTVMMGFARLKLASIAMPFFSFIRYYYVVSYRGNSTLLSGIFYALQRERPSLRSLLSYT